MNKVLICVGLAVMVAGCASQHNGENSSGDGAQTPAQETTQNHIPSETEKSISSIISDAATAISLINIGL